MKKIPWWEPQVGSELEKKLILQTLEDNYVNEGKFAMQFEEKIAALVGVKYGVCATSCTAAMFLALKGLGVGTGDEVIVPDMTFIATANAAQMSGATPVLVDVDDNLLISPEAVRKAITPKTKAIMPVHVTGRAGNIDEIIAIAKEHNLLVVEDAAEALTSKHNGKYLGTFGQAGCYSFSPNKAITTGQGGVVVTDDYELSIRLRELKDQGRPKRGTGGNDVHDTIGYNFKFTNLQAALGLGQLELLVERTARMREIYKLYQKHLADVPKIKLFPCDLEGGAVPQWTDAIIERRDELVKYLHDQEIDSREYWFPLHTQLAYKLPDENFLNSTRLSPRSLWLPSAFTLTDDDIAYVCDHITKFFGR